MIKELIVVEGKDDIAAVKRAVDAHIIQTSGLGLEEKTYEIIQNAVERTGVIVFTDPDFAGEKIRRMINDRVSGCKHAYLPRDEGTKNGNIGIENASPEAIIKALEDVKTVVEGEAIHTSESIGKLGLLYGNNAKAMREKTGEALGIGYANGKQFLQRINAYQISEEVLLKAVNKIKEKV
ncbi:ribonuclease M5 [Alkalibacter saccharofermentans]|uniref:Ribonuclease M5 n=1 Tax=Alkalibacter saccharofermentans DSM 14828 TaxID=1120975 RepID=A0A1M4TBX2_9FIRM|nr:ribonuclease M5 [Alkalibacter saccharofermentans]SHE41885.1 ribonuclease M5 [Alkalibacter saccharofermentans DSM 14828]